jgi:hypothetical protein
MLKTNTSTFWNSHQQPPRGIKNNHPSDSYVPPALHEADNHRIKLNADQRRTRCETALHEGTHLGVAIALGGYCHGGKSPGAPSGEKHWNYKHGQSSKAAIGRRRETRELRKH